ncbi:hypothetical protein BKA67DRAFT_225798 [Truncatella angustata]|uniref:Uncharacterized protein n=1 Tax=Truncatella angustata TaxID=152316 RepID=A0A9P8UMN4_9PEZI|nr:uncharacterized protein BKA67DRAFT_225798 [Truncatella angustata]KAH6655081.1 hypothetical protein BKA67DRAFT_225798 [Truncatella angustata]
MREGNDLDSFLQNGYWANSRATPDPRPSRSSRLPFYSYNDSSVPRSSHSTEYPTDLRRPSFHPPAPTVEDEVESIAKEHGSVVSAHPEEEPKHRGEPDQDSLIDVVHEYNPERRFVFVPNSSSATDDARDELKKSAKSKRTDGWAANTSPTKDSERYEANTCRKFTLVAPDGEEDKNKPKLEQDERGQRRQRRKSRLEELPSIVTEFDREGRGHDRRDDIRRSRSAAGVEPGPDDYFSPRRSSQRLQENTMLSPDVIKHSTKGRDRMYYDYSGATTPNQGRVRTSQTEDPHNKRSQRRPDEGMSRSYSTGPDPRQDPEPPRNVRRTSKEGSMAYNKDYSRYEKPRSYPERPSKTSRTGSSSATSRPDRESLRPRSSSFRSKRGSSPYEDSRYSSEEEYERRPEHRRGKSFVREERNGHLSTPVETSRDGRRSKPSTPLTSPRVSQRELLPESYENNLSRSPRSATFPIIRDNQKVYTKYPGEEDPLSRPLSRASTARSVLNSAAPIAIPVITAAAAVAVQNSVSPSDRRSSGIPVSEKPRVPTDTGPDSRSSSSSTPSSSNSSKRSSWQPHKFDPIKDGVQRDRWFPSYRRYSEGWKEDLPDLPDCSRTREEAGHMDWLTLPRCNNFNICPACYQSAFGDTEWRNAFVPAPFRPRDRPLKCDLGGTMWYRIAWLLTHKYRHPDLRLFQGLNNVTASHRPCSGTQPAVHVWYTIKDPATQHPVRGFNTCQYCAKSIETLLPNLSGVFVPMDSPAEARNGICSMRQYVSSSDPRKRFVDYFDLMETASDRALEASSAPDMHALADKVRELSLIDECYGSLPIRERKWYSMRSVPAFTACEECFNEVMSSQIERDFGGIQAEFYRTEKLDLAACQLYSSRMRRYFKHAVVNDDLEYFRNKVERRAGKEAEFYARIRDLDANVLGREWVDAEIERATGEWRRHE